MEWERAVDIAQKILDNLNDRAGISFDMIDEDVYSEMLGDIAEIIQKEVKHG